MAYNYDMSGTSLPLQPTPLGRDPRNPPVLSENDQYGVPSDYYYIRLVLAYLQFFVFSQVCMSFSTVCVFCFVRLVYTLAK